MRAIGFLLQVVFFLGLIVASLLAGGVISNRVPVGDPPGAVARLTAYLTTNVAEVSPESDFPELRQPRYEAPPALLFDVLRRSAEGLRWDIRVLDPQKKEIQAVVTSRIWRFKDDVVARAEPAPKGGGSILYVRSASRVGKGDLGANIRHVMDLRLAVEARLPVEALPRPEEATPPTPEAPAPQAAAAGD